MERTYTIHDTNEDNIFTDVISTAGMQILTVTAVYDNCPSEIPYSYGEYYLFGILRIIPNVTGGTNIFITDSIDTMFAARVEASCHAGKCSE